MSRFGGRPAKVLAVVAGFMTVAAGRPVVGCVCPDGRVKLFCPGPLSPSRCCLHPATAPGGAELKGCCQRTVLVPDSAFTAEGEETGPEPVPAALSAPVRPPGPAKAIPELRRLATPPDLTVLFCHFTC